eukprot:9484198-Pyramimonas_sp.AAC.1
MSLRTRESTCINVDAHAGTPLTRIAPASCTPTSKAAGAAPHGVPATRAGRPEGVPATRAGRPLRGAERASRLAPARDARPERGLNTSNTIKSPQTPKVAAMRTPPLGLHA